MNKIVIWIIVVIVIAFVAFGFVMYLQNAGVQAVPSTSTSTPPIASGTTPPIPIIPSGQGTVQGSVLLGPTCPVEHNPPLPGCAPKPYQTTIHIQPANSSTPHQTVTTNASGTFSIMLYPGTYIFQAQGGNSVPPTCRPVQVAILASTTQTLIINCDTGIR